MQSVAGSGLGWEGLESTGEELRLELRTQALWAGRERRASPSAEGPLGSLHDHVWRHWPRHEMDAHVHFRLSNIHSFLRVAEAQERFGSIFRMVPPPPPFSSVSGTEPLMTSDSSCALFTQIAVLNRNSSTEEILYDLPNLYTVHLRS